MSDKQDKTPYMRPENFCYWCNRTRKTNPNEDYKCVECISSFSFLNSKEKEVKNTSYQDKQVVDGYHLTHGFHSGW